MASAAYRVRQARFHEEMLWLGPVAALAIGLFALAQALGAAYGLSPLSMLSAYGYKALRVLPALLCVALVIQLVLAVREAPGAPLAAFTGRLRRIPTDPWLLAAHLAPLLLMPLVFVGFSSLKMLMPQFVPFWLDDPFAAADRALFFGRQPWELTHAVLGSPEATYMIDRIYSFWVLLLSIAIVAMALFAPRKDRARFFLAFTMAWVLLGVAGAWLGASAGPCYSALIGASSAPEFAGLMERLSTMSIESAGAINAPGWQQVLWRAHDSETYAFGMGISAMPSLHNAVAILYAFSAFRVGRLIGWFMAAFAFVIFVGSVHLGWHYAVDGIVALPLMWLIWRWADHWCRRSGYDEAVAASGRA